MNIEHGKKKILPHGNNPHFLTGEALLQPDQNWKAAKERGKELIVTFVIVLTRSIMDANFTNKD